MRGAEEVAKRCCWIRGACCACERNCWTGRDTCCVGRDRAERAVEVWEPDALVWPETRFDDADCVRDKRWTGCGAELCVVFARADVGWTEGSVEAEAATDFQLVSLGVVAVASWPLALYAGAERAT